MSSSAIEAVLQKPLTSKVIEALPLYVSQKDHKLFFIKITETAFQKYFS